MKTLCRVNCHNVGHRLLLNFLKWYFISYWISLEFRLKRFTLMQFYKYCIVIPPYIVVLFLIHSQSTERLILNSCFRLNQCFIMHNTWQRNKPFMLFHSFDWPKKPPKKPVHKELSATSRSTLSVWPGKQHKRGILGRFEEGKEVCHVPFK